MNSTSMTEPIEMSWGTLDLTTEKYMDRFDGQEYYSFTIKLPSSKLEVGTVLGFSTREDAKSFGKMHAEMYLE